MNFIYYRYNLNKLLWKNKTNKKIKNKNIILYNYYEFDFVFISSIFFNVSSTLSGKNFKYVP